MPGWAILLLKYVLPVILKQLHKHGYDSAAEDFALRLGFKVYTNLQDVKSFHAPESFPIEKSRQNVPKHTLNINKGRDA